ncbi:globin [Necator americanus]|uniref:Globin n=1 Tax=Necator americanus TaxID=51031 RepID=W2TM46_NECAM|nr:globin [Necator americanus]ETN82808.1 globin [Necator americanus]
MVSPTEVKKLTVASLGIIPLGETPDKIQNGKDFYKFLFTNHPDLRRYFKDAENFTADDVQKSERFEKQGNALLLSVHLLANTYDNEEVFRAICRDHMNRHAARSVDPNLWKAFWDVWMAFLESKGAILSADQKAAWEALGTTFNEECQSHLAKLGLPHV